jgi:hypothetical protein
MSGADRSNGTSTLPLSWSSGLSISAAEWVRADRARPDLRATPIIVHDEHKGLIGDLYVRRAFRHPEYEHRLLAAVVETLMRTQFVTRIETQLMMLGPGHTSLPGSRIAEAYDRNFMRIDLRRTVLPPAQPLRIRGFTTGPGRTGIRTPPPTLFPKAYRGPYRQPNQRPVRHRKRSAAFPV